MTAYSGVFARTEMKYRMKPSQLTAITPALNTHLMPAGFTDASVRSLYYDTPSDDLIARSIEAPPYKEKLRLRVYGSITGPDMPAFIEIKKKYKGTVYKRRAALSLAGAEAFLAGLPYEEACAVHPIGSKEMAVHAESAKNRQIANEIAFFMKRHGPLLPSILTVCERCSLVSSACANRAAAEAGTADANANRPTGVLGALSAPSDLRITIDTHLQAKANPSSIRDADSLAPLIPEDEAIMEIKSTLGLPMWLTSALSDARAYKQSFSKCGTAFKTLKKGA